MSIDYRDPVERWPGHRGPTMRPRGRVRTRVAMAAVALGVGLLVGVQAQEGGTDRIARLAAERPEDLTRILADLNQRADELARQVSSLRVRVLRYRRSASADELALQDARRTLHELQVLSGTVPVAGPGVEVVVSDPGGNVEWESLLDLIQELRDAGAEAVAVGQERVVASTWLGPGDGGVVVQGTALEPPYVLRAVGDASAIQEALLIPGGPVSVISAGPRVQVRIDPVDRMVLPPLRERSAFEYARPTS